MNTSQRYKQTPEFMERAELIKRYIFENRDRELLQMEIARLFDMSRMHAKSALEHLEVAGVIESRSKDGRCLYRWCCQDNIHDGLLRSFLANAVIRNPIREFVI